MTKLYSKLARAYHEMYQSIFDYKKEFKFYYKILKKFKCKRILEIGCGSGNLAPFFLKSGYNYVGLDLSNEMIKIAKEFEPKARFVQGDMRNLKLKNKFDAILITGRSFTYLTTNKEIIKTLKSINSKLNNNGILVFDNFNAEEIIGLKKKKFTQTANFKNRKYKRVSEKTPNLDSGWTENWNVVYYITENNKIKIVRDKSIIRSFTLDELNLFLKLTNFKVIDFIKQNFSFTTIAIKI